MLFPCSVNEYRPMYVEKIMKYMDSPFVKILTGIRRCGKSTILKMIIEELKKRGISENRILSYRFDSMEYEDMTAKEMFTEIKGKLSSTEKTYIFLDEVQEIKHWEKTVNSLASDYNVDIYVTGSNSRMMSSELQHTLPEDILHSVFTHFHFQSTLILKKNFQLLQI